MPTVYDLSLFLFRSLPKDSPLSALDCEVIARRMLASEELLAACLAAQDFIGIRFYANRDNGIVWGKLGRAIRKAKGEL